MLEAVSDSYVPSVPRWRIMPMRNRISSQLRSATTMRGERIMNRGQWLVSAGCVILFGTAIYHAADYTSMARAMGVSDAQPALIAGMKALWVVFSLHLIILGVLAFSASRCVSARQLILLCSLMPLLDTLLLLKFLGMFPGIILLASVVCVFWAGAYLLPGPAHRGAGN